MADNSDLEKVLADLRRNRQKLENALGDDTGARAAIGVVDKLRDLRRRADETSRLIEELKQQQKTTDEPE